MTESNEILAYAALAEDSRRSLFDHLLSLIRTQSAGTEEKLRWKIPAFYNEKKKWVALGYRKDGVSLYTENFEVIEAFRKKHPKIKTGMGSIIFRMKDIVPDDDVKEVVRQVLG
jgi:uncharacterized protein YdhG (YjbR/CyaY superfamily)